MKKKFLSFMLILFYIFNFNDIENEKIKAEDNNLILYICNVENYKTHRIKVENKHLDFKIYNYVKFNLNINIDLSDMVIFYKGNIVSKNSTFKSVGFEPFQKIILMEKDRKDYKKEVYWEAMSGRSGKLVKKRRTRLAVEIEQSDFTRMERESCEKFLKDVRPLKEKFDRDINNFMKINNSESTVIKCASAPCEEALPLLWN